MTTRRRPPAARRLAVAVTLPLATALALTPAAATGAAPTGTSGSSTSATSPTATGLARASTAQRQVDETQAAYEQARERVAAISRQATRLIASAERAEATAAELRRTVSDEDGGFFQAVGDLVDPGESDLDLAADAADDAAHTRGLADMAAEALAASIAETEQARVRWEKAQQHQEGIEAKWTARQVAAAAIRRSELDASYAVTDPAQDRRNRAALATWQDQLRRTGALGVVPPPAKELADPDRLAAPLQKVYGANDGVVPGVARASSPDRGSVTVLPAETVRAVSDAFHRLGLADVPGAVEPSTYACGGLVANAWGAARLTLPAEAAAQWQELRSVPPRSWQVGDLVVLGSRSHGLERTGVYVGDARAILADATTGTAGVEEIDPRDVLGVRRPTLAVTTTTDPRPEAPVGGTCGLVDPAVVTGDGTGPFVPPVATGAYRLSSGFGSTGPLWSTGEHTGMDFSAPTGTPAVAAASGVVSVEHPDWAGNLVRIDHGGGVETWYAHLDRVDVVPGQTVGDGQQVGSVGDLGNTTGPHLHFEVRLDGVAVDPVEVLDLPEHPRTAYTNGEAPLSVLCPATADGSQLLRCDAAVAFRLLGAAFELGTGEPLCITDSYRSRLGQEKVFVRKPNLAATPGTSVHGWGLAVDLCGGVERFGTTQNTWLLAHAPAYGWSHPSWAAAGGSRPEPWHFEYGG